MKTYKIHLLRHGITAANDDGRYIGRTDLPGGDMSVLRHSLKRLAELKEDYTIYAGHGEQTTLSFQKKANPYLVF